MAATAWLFRNYRAPSTTSPERDETERVTTRHRLAEISNVEGKTQEAIALASWDTSAYHALLFVNLVEPSPIWNDGGGKKTTSARLMLERCLFWAAVGFFIAWCFRYLLRMHWNRRSTQRKVDSKRMAAADQASVSNIWDLSTGAMAALNAGKIPEEWDRLHAPHLLSFPRVENVIGMLVVIPCVLAFATFISDVAEGYEEVGHVTNLIAVFISGSIVAMYFSITAIAVKGASGIVPSIEFVKRDAGGGHWRSCRVDRRHFASRYGLSLASQRGPEDERDKRRLVAYAWIGPTLLCLAALCCAYGGSAHAGNERRGMFAFGAGFCMALDSVLSMSIRPMHTRIWNFFDVIATLCICAGFVLHGMHFTRNMKGSSELGVGLHLASVLVLALVEFMVSLGGVWSFIWARCFGKRQGQSRSLSRSTTLSSASFKGDPVRIAAGHWLKLAGFGKGDVGGIVLEDTPIGASKVRVALLKESGKSVVKTVPVSHVIFDDEVQRDDKNSSSSTKSKETDKAKRGWRILSGMTKVMFPMTPGARGRRNVNSFRLDDESGISSSDDRDLELNSFVIQMNDTSPSPNIRSAKKQVPLYREPTIPSVPSNPLKDDFTDRRSGRRWKTLSNDLNGVVGRIVEDGVSELNVTRSELDVGFGMKAGESKDVSSFLFR